MNVLVFSVIMTQPREEHEENSSLKAFDVKSDGQCQTRDA